jgi:hypothetical protein
VDKIGGHFRLIAKVAAHKLSGRFIPIADIVGAAVSDVMSAADHVRNRGHSVKLSAVDLHIDLDRHHL